MSNLIQFNSVYKSYPNESMGVKEALVSIYNREKKNYHETHPTLENITFSVIRPSWTQWRREKHTYLINFRHLKA